MVIFVLPNVYMAIRFGYDDVYFQVGNSNNTSIFQFYLFAVHFLLLLILFLLTCFSDERPPVFHNLDQKVSGDELLINDSKQTNGAIVENVGEFVDSFELKSPYQNMNGDKNDVRKSLLRKESQNSAAEEVVQLKECPATNASFLSNLTFWWFNGLAKTGFMKSLTLNDLWLLNPDDATSNIAPVFDRNWIKNTEKKHRRTRTVSHESGSMKVSVAFVEPGLKGGIVRTLLQTFGWYFVGGAIFKFMHDLLLFVQPQLLR